MSSAVSIPGNAQIQIGHWPGQPAHGDPLLGMEDWTRRI